MNRRSFLRASLGTLGLIAAGAPAVAKPKPAMATRLTILHTNDVHSHLDPAESGDYAGMGGAPARARLIEQYRRREKSVLLLDAGDMFQGTPYFNIFRGEPELKAMSAVRYDAGTIGNHEFDAGIDRLAEVVRDHAKFPLLNGNYDFSDTPMAGLTRETLVLERDGVRIGLFGLGIRLEGLVLKGSYGDTRYRTPMPEARRLARQLRTDEKCDLVICLSHLNILNAEKDREPGDRDLIAEVPEIDVILGGHNHFHLTTPEARWRRDAPMGFIGQAGWAGTHIGVMQFDLFDGKRRELANASMAPAG